MFKTPPEILGTPSSVAILPSPTTGSYPPVKRKRGPKAKDQNGKRRRRTAEDFLSFCKTILDYENYDQLKSQDLRTRHSSSPMGSTGSSNESWPLSKDYDADLYPSPNVSRGEKYNDDNDDDSNSQDLNEADESWDEVSCYCGKPFAGRPMIECSKCLTWLHLKCAGIRKSNIPETWHCSKCKKSGPGDGSKKPVTGSRKRKSTKMNHPVKRPQDATLTDNYTQSS